jgi:hypothetical protein
MRSETLMTDPRGRYSSISVSVTTTKKISVKNPSRWRIHMELSKRREEWQGKSGWRKLPASTK